MPLMLIASILAGIAGVVTAVGYLVRTTKDKDPGPPPAPPCPPK